MSSVGNPFTAGTARADTRYRLGDSYSYRSLGSPPRNEPPGDYTNTVTGITDSEVIMNHGEVVFDLLGNTVRTRGGVTFTPRQDQPREFAVGNRWTTLFTESRNGKRTGRTSLEYRIVGREKVTVPAGTFNCFKIAMAGTFIRGNGQPPVDRIGTFWLAPEHVRRPIARERENREVQRGHVRTLWSDRIELVSFKQEIGST